MTDADRDERFYPIWIAKAIKDTLYWMRLADYPAEKIRAIGKLFLDAAERKEGVGQP